MKNFKKQKNEKLLKTNEGVVALLTVLIISVSALIMAYNSSLLGLGELDMGYSSQKGVAAFYIADGCTEEAFRRLRLDSGYSGGSLTLNGGSCIINIVPSGSDRTITVTASTTDSYYKKIETNITLSADAIPVITLNSWEEQEN